MIVRFLFGRQNRPDPLLLQSRYLNGKSWTSAGKIISIYSLQYIIIWYRSWDGLTLYAASSDGTLAVFNFDPEELEGISPHSVQEQYLAKFGFTPPPIPDGFSHVPSQNTTQITPPPSPSRQSQNQMHSEFGGVNGSGGERVNMLVAKRGNKKRAKLGQPSAPSTFTGQSSGSSSGSRVNGAPPSKRAQLIQIQDNTKSTNVQPTVTSPRNKYSFPSPSEQLYDAPDNWSRHGDMAMDLDVPIDSLDTVDGKGKRKGSLIDLTDDVRPTKARTLGGDRVREKVLVKEIVSSRGGSRGPGITLWNQAEHHAALPVPALLTYLSSEVEGAEGLLEGRNSEEDGVYTLTRASPGY